MQDTSLPRFSSAVTDEQNREKADSVGTPLRLGALMLTDAPGELEGSRSALTLALGKYIRRYLFRWFGAGIVWSRCALPNSTVGANYPSERICVACKH